MAWVIRSGGRTVYGARSGVMSRVEPAYWKTSSGCRTTLNQSGTGLMGVGARRSSDRARLLL